MTQNRVAWVLQWLLAVTFVGTGVWKLLTPIDALAAKIPWAGEVAPGFLMMTAVVDLLGGLGLVVPALTGIKPKLTFFAALGCCGLQASAIAFHISRGELVNTPFNVLLFALCGFVAFVRR